MRFRVHRTARFLLALMLATFLSPAFAWHMHAGHDEIAAQATASHAHHDDADSHAQADGPMDAHASIGHLLGHLTMQLARLDLRVLAAEDIAPLADVPAPPLRAETSPPYRPPLPLRLA